MSHADLVPRGRNLWRRLLRRTHEPTEPGSSDYASVHIEQVHRPAAGPTAASPADRPVDDDAPLGFSDLVLDPRTREVSRGGRVIELTRIEFRLLELFLRNPRQILTREVIFERVWGFDFEVESNTLNVFIGYLRRKTELGGEPRLIHTVRGVGYMLRDLSPVSGDRPQPVT